MSQPQLLQVKLSRFDAQPWGFRLQGGVDFASPLVVQKVNGGSLAEQAGLIPGDAVLKINDVDVYNLRHKDAQDIVVRSGNNFVLTIQRGGSTWRPLVTPTGQMPLPQQGSQYLQTVTKTSLAHKQHDSQHIGCGYNNSARPFVNGGDGNVKSIVNKQYNTPVGIYSDESIAETLSAQAEVLAGGVLGVNFKKNEKEYQADKSEVLKFLREEETGDSTPEVPSPANFYWTQSHAIGGNERRTPLSHQHPQKQQENVDKTKSQPGSLVPQKPAANPTPATSSRLNDDPRVIILPVCPALQGPEYKAEMEAATAALHHDDGPRPLSASGHPACALCGVGIVGVFVRIKDKNLHVECFKCATCGTSLKNQGYYNFNNKLYCDIHAKLAAMQNPPPGTEGYVPVPIRPNTKLCANTVSSALSAHGFGDISAVNGSSAPSNVPVNQGYAKPYGAAAVPPVAAPKSPVSYPPQRPMVNPYATLPRTNVGPQGRRVNIYNNYNNYSAQYKKPVASTYGSNKYATMPSFNSSHYNSYNNSLYIQAGSITTGKSYLGAQQAQHQQNQMMSEYESTTQARTQNYTENPEKTREFKINDYTVQTKEKQTSLFDQKQSNLCSQQKMKIGNVEIERRQKVTEEYEHVSNAKTIEIRTDNTQMSATERRQSYGKTGYVANQARRLSGLEQEITNLTSQSQAISARAANLSEISFPQLSSPEPLSKFPIKPVLSPHDEPKPPSYLFSAPSGGKMVDPPPGFTQQNSQQQKMSTTHGTLMVPQQQQKSLSTFSSSTNTSTTTSLISSQANAAINVGNLTKASIITNNKQISAASAPTEHGPTAICSVTGTFCRPGHTCCKQLQLQAAPLSAFEIGQASNNNAINNPYRPNASTGTPELKTSNANAHAQAFTAAPASAVSANAINAAQVAATAAETAAAVAVAAVPPTATSFPPPQIDDKINASVGGSTGAPGKGTFGATSAPKRGRGIFNKAVEPGVRIPMCNSCNIQIRGPFITALGRIWCPEHFICVNANCRRPLQDIGFVEEKGDLYCEYCFEKYLAPTCNKCGGKIKGDCLNAIGKQFHPECFTCAHCGKLFGNTPFFLEDGNAYCETDWNELFTTKCFACGFPVEAGDRWVEALNHNYHSQCFNCTYCKQNLEGQSFYNKGGRPFCKNHAR